MDCFAKPVIGRRFAPTRWLAMTLMELTGKLSRSRGTIRPRFAKISSPKEGAGNAGCALHPRSRVQIVRNLRTRAYRFSGNTPASPAQWLYGLWRALLGDEFLFVTVAAGLMADRSGWIASATGSLTSATDAGTTRFCRTQPDSAKRSAGVYSPTKNHTKPALAPFVCAPVDRSRKIRPAISFAPTLPRPPHPTPRS
jgi:hypothetical protein